MQRCERQAGTGSVPLMICVSAVFLSAACFFEYSAVQRTVWSIKHIPVSTELNNDSYVSRYYPHTISLSLFRVMPGRVVLQVESVWKSTEFSVVPLAGQKDVFILGGTDDIQQLLDESNINIQVNRHTPQQQPCRVSNRRYSFTCELKVLSDGCLHLVCVCLTDGVCACFSDHFLVASRRPHSVPRGGLGEATRPLRQNSGRSAVHCNVYS